MSPIEGALLNAAPADEPHTSRSRANATEPDGAFGQAFSAVSNGNPRSQSSPADTCDKSHGSHDSPSSTDATAHGTDPASAATPATPTTTPSGAASGTASTPARAPATGSGDGGPNVSATDDAAGPVAVVDPRRDPPGHGSRRR